MTVPRRLHGVGKRQATDVIDRRALVELSRHTSWDTVVIAGPRDAGSTDGTDPALNLGPRDVDGLAMVVEKLWGPHLNLVLHGFCGNLEHAGQMMTMLRGRFERVHALVPDCALSALAVLACACDRIMMPGSARFGAADAEDQTAMTPEMARKWLATHYRRRDFADRAEALEQAIALEDCPRVPLAARRARDLGLPVDLVPELSDLGRTLFGIRRCVEKAMRDSALVRLIDCQKGPLYCIAR